MIRAFFNLKDLPFAKNICKDLLFASASFAEANKRLDYIKDNRGIFLLTGDPGVGKTTLVRSFLANLSSNYEAFYIPLATVSVFDFYHQLNTYLHKDFCHRKSALFASIQDAIKNLVTNRKVVPILIFDEAHLLKPDNFYELQLILNFDQDSTTPAIVILIGQSHLRDKLARSILVSFNQRITLKYHLIPLNKQETCNFIAHAMKIVGGSDALFSSQALEAVFNNSQGNIRLITKIASKSLFAAAYSNNSLVSEEHVFAATSEI